MESSCAKVSLAPAAAGPLSSLEEEFSCDFRTTKFRRRAPPKAWAECLRRESRMGSRIKYDACDRI